MFDDPLDPDGTNRTGIYSLRMKLTKEIPELIPLDGLRIKIIHHQVRKLCARCYKGHLRKNCESEKKSWFDYVRKFMNENVEINKEFYGGLYERIKKESKTTKAATRPKPDDYCLPRSQIELDKLLSRMTECGIDDARAMEMLKERKEKFEYCFTQVSREIDYSLKNLLCTCYCI